MAISGGNRPTEGVDAPGLRAVVRVGRQDTLDIAGEFALERRVDEIGVRASAELRVHGWGDGGGRRATCLT